MIPPQIFVRQAKQTDYHSIANLIYFEPTVHRHLDWRGPLEWLGSPEYWVLIQSGTVLATLACPPDPEGVAWIRLFAHSKSISTQDAWNTLWEPAKEALQSQKLIAAAISVVNWLDPYLYQAGFVVNQKIVVLEHDMTVTPQILPSPKVILRTMNESDLPTVEEVDKSGFVPLWRNSRPALISGFTQPGYSTVALLDGEIVGYQISTRSTFGIHLARLAVLPRVQGLGIGYLLVQDLILYCKRLGMRRLTVNTQNDNFASLSLYKKIGFELTTEAYTVFSQQF